MRTDLAVIESRWERETNKSVKPIFDLITQGFLNNEFDAIPYERFISKSGLAEAIDYFNSNKNILTIYIGCHGDERRLCVGEYEKMDAKSLLEVIKMRRFEDRENPIKGMFVGSCYFGRKANAKILLGFDSPLTWFAGYRDEVDWGLSSLLDGFFMMEYVNIRLRNVIQKYKTRNTLIYVCKSIRKHNSGLISNLKFSVYLKLKNAEQEIVDLMEISDEELDSLGYYKGD